MNYYIPSDEQLENALKNILKKFRVIQSQNRLTKLVKKEIDTKKKKYGVTGSRLRKIAINSDYIKLEIHSRKGDPKKLMTKCPVCKGLLKRVKNQTIWGGKVTIEFNCPNCGYWTGKKKRIPTRYVFHLEKKKIK